MGNLMKFIIMTMVMIITSKTARTERRLPHSEEEAKFPQLSTAITMNFTSTGEEGEYTTAPPLSVAAVDQGFTFNFNNYLGTTNGIFNLMEVVCGTVLYFLMASNNRWETKTLRFVCSTAYTFAFNGMHMLIAGLLSALSASYLPALFYYVMFQGVGAACYIIGCIMLVKETHDVSVQEIIGLTTGGIHAFHFFYVVYRVYIR